MLTNHLIELFKKLKLPLDQIYDEDGNLTKIASIVLIFFCISRVFNALGKSYIEYLINKFFN